jgi:hypothetical protein
VQEVLDNAATEIAPLQANGIKVLLSILGNHQGAGFAQLAPAAIDIQSTSASTATSLAEQTVDSGYGAYNTYNLPDTDVSQYLSSFTKPLYGSDAVYTG